MAQQYQTPQNQNQQYSPNPWVGTAAGIAYPHIKSALGFGTSNIPGSATLPAGSVGSYGAGAISVPAGQAVPSGFTGIATDAATGATIASPATTSWWANPVMNPYLGIASGLAGGYNIAHNFGQLDPMSGALSGAGVAAGLGGAGSLAGLAGMSAIGGPVGLLAGAAIGAGLSVFKKSGKHKDNVTRDKLRGKLKESGVLDQDTNFTLADGSKFYAGKDGGSHAYDLDTSKNFAEQARGYAIPLARLMGYGEQGPTEWMAGYTANAATSNAKSEADVKANIRAIADKMGGIDTIKNGLTQLMKNQKISKEEYDAALNGVDSFYEVGAYGSGKNSGKKSSPKQQAPIVVQVQQQESDPLVDWMPKPIKTDVMPGDTMSAPPAASTSYGSLLQEMARRAGYGA